MFGFGDGPAIRVEGPFTPADMANLEMWLNAPSLSGSDSDPVTTWTKAGGASGVSPTQASAGLKPILRTGANGINGLQAVQFDGSNDLLLGTFDAGSTGFTIYIVGRTGAALSNYGTVVGSGGTAAGDNDTPGIGWSFAYGNAADTFGAGWAGSAAQIGLGDVTGVAINTAFYARYRTNKVAWSIDGPNSTTPADTSFPTGTFQMHVGASATTAGTPQFPFNGRIGEIIVCSRYVGDVEDAVVKSYLETKWGL